jgi:hypothetical protein
MASNFVSIFSQDGQGVHAAAGVKYQRSDCFICQFPMAIARAVVAAFVTFPHNLPVFFVACRFQKEHINFPNIRSLRFQIHQRLAVEERGGQC